MKTLKIPAFKVIAILVTVCFLCTSTNVNILFAETPVPAATDETKTIPVGSTSTAPLESTQFQQEADAYQENRSLSPSMRDHDPVATTNIVKDTAKDIYKIYGYNAANQLVEYSEYRLVNDTDQGAILNHDLRTYYSNGNVETKYLTTYNETTGAVSSIVDYHYNETASGKYIYSDKYRVNADGSEGTLSTTTEYIYLGTTAKSSLVLTYAANGTTVTQREEDFVYYTNKNISSKHVTTYSSTTGLATAIYDYFYSETAASHYTNIYQYRANTDGTKGTLAAWTTDYVYGAGDFKDLALSKKVISYGTDGITPSKNTYYTYTYHSNKKMATQTVVIKNGDNSIITQTDEYTYNTSAQATWWKTTTYRAADGTRSKETEYIYLGTTAKSSLVLTYAANGTTVTQREEDFVYYTNKNISSKHVTTYSSTTGLATAIYDYFYSETDANHYTNIYRYRVKTDGTKGTLYTLTTDYVYGTGDLASLVMSNKTVTYDTDGATVTKNTYYTYTYHSNKKMATQTVVIKNGDNSIITQTDEYTYNTSAQATWWKTTTYRAADGTRSKETEYIYLGTTSKTSLILTYAANGTTVTQKDEYAYDTNTKLTSWKKTTAYRSADGTKSKETEYMYMGTDAKTSLVVTYAANGTTVTQREEDFVYYANKNLSSKHVTTYSSTTGKPAAIYDYFYSETDANHYTNIYRYRVKTDGTKGTLYTLTTDYVYGSGDFVSLVMSKKVVTYGSNGITVSSNQYYSYGYYRNKMMSTQKIVTTNASGTITSNVMYEYSSTISSRKTAYITFKPDSTDTMVSKISYAEDGVTQIRKNTWEYDPVTNELVSSKQYAMPSNQLLLEYIYEDGEVIETDSYTYYATGGVDTKTGTGSYYLQWSISEVKWEYNETGSLDKYTEMQIDELNPSLIWKYECVYANDAPISDSMYDPAGRLVSSGEYYNPEGWLKKDTEYIYVGGERKESSVTEYAYNADGTPALRIGFEYNEDGTVKATTEELFDEAGLPTKTTVTTQSVRTVTSFSGGVPVTREEYSISSNTLVKKDIYNAAGTSIVQTDEYTYHANAVIATHTVILYPEDKKMVFENNEAGQVVKYTERRLSDGALISEKVYEYDVASVLRITRTYNSTGGLARETHYSNIGGVDTIINDINWSYNAAGTIMVQKMDEEFYDSGRLKVRTVYNYQTLTATQYTYQDLQTPPAPVTTSWSIAISSWVAAESPVVTASYLNIIPGAWVIGIDGYMMQYINVLTDGVYRITFVANGATSPDGWPILGLSVDGLEQTTISINKSDPALDQYGGNGVFDPTILTDPAARTYIVELNLTKGMHAISLDSLKGAGIMITNVDIKNAVAAQPSPVLCKDAEWQKWGEQKEEEALMNAEKAIEANRKGDVSIKIVDAEGNVISDSNITIEQIKQAFQFGGNYSFVGKFEDETLNIQYNLELLNKYAAMFDEATVPFFWGSLAPTVKRVDGNIVRDGNGNMIIEFNETEVAVLDQMLGLLWQKGITDLIGGALVWGDERSMPQEWLSGLTETEKKEALKALIQKLIKDYSNRSVTTIDINDPFNADRRVTSVVSINTWEVLNEPYHLGTLGCTITEIFDWAAEARDQFAPDAKLMLNDYNLLLNGNLPIYESLEQLVNSGIKFDILGVQAHHLIKDPDTVIFDVPFQMDNLHKVLDKYAELGKSILISEFEMPSNDNDIISSPWRGTNWDEATRSQYVKDFYTMIFSHPAVEGLTWWDIVDYYDEDLPMWCPDAGLLTDGYTIDPVTGQMTIPEKQAYTELYNLIKDQWTTNIGNTATDPNGEYSFRGFYGKYKITVTVDSTQKEYYVDVIKGADNDFTLTFKEEVRPDIVTRTEEVIDTVNNVKKITGYNGYDQVAKYTEVRWYQANPSDPLNGTLIKEEVKTYQGTEASSPVATNTITTYNSSGTVIAGKEEIVYYASGQPESRTTYNYAAATKTANKISYSQAGVVIENTSWTISDASWNITDSPIKTFGYDIPDMYGPGADVWYVNLLGIAEQYINVLEDGTYQVRFLAAGSYVSGQWPIVGVSVDGLEEQYVTVTNDYMNPTFYTVTLELTKGIHSLSLDFVNATEQETNGDWRYLVLGDVAITNSTQGKTAPVICAAEEWQRYAAQKEAMALIQARIDIDANRKTDATVTVIKDGVPVDGAKVQIEQTNNAFTFGGSYTWIEKFPAADGDTPEQLQEKFLKNLEYNMEVLDKLGGVFEQITLPIMWKMTTPTVVKDGNGNVTDLTLNEAAVANINYELSLLTQKGFTDIVGSVLVWANAIEMMSGWPELEGLDQANKKKALELYIKKAIQAFPAIKTWQVLGEPYYLDTFGCTIKEIFDWADEARDAYNPDAKLMLNEYVLLLNGCKYAYDDLVNIASEVKFDILGIQAHHFVDAYFAFETPYQMHELKSMLDQYAAIGKSIYITEFEMPASDNDVVGSPWRGTTWDEATRSQYVQDFYTMVFSHPAVTGITYWEPINGAAMNADGGIITDQLVEQETYKDLDTLINNVWLTTICGAATDMNGQYSFKGFFGKYKITVTVNGETRYGYYDILQDQDDLLLDFSTMTPAED